MTMATKQDILRDKLGEYLVANRRRKGEILVQIEVVTHLRRKAIIRRFNQHRRGRVSTQERRGRPELYGPAVTGALKAVWRLAHEICAERLHPMVAEYVAVLQRDAMWFHDPATTGLLRRMSLGTMKDRIGTFERARGRRKARGMTHPSNLKEIIPIRRGPWQNPRPGFGEVDTVAHCGSSIQGDFGYTVQYTDVATIWTGLAGQWNKGERETGRSIERIRQRLPFPLRGIDPDSGSEFINWHLKDWCDRQEVAMTRTRPYMKNDHARIEQKNYAHVRDFVGYARLDDPRAVGRLNVLYDDLEDYINFFLPSVKCLRKEREGSHTHRVYDRSQTAYQRVLAHPQITEDRKDRLRAKYATLNPKVLKDRIDRHIHLLLMNTHY